MVIGSKIRDWKETDVEIQSLRRKDDHCRECGEPWKTPKYSICICRMLHISIPAGQHIHIDCPAHGRVRIDGPNITW